MPTINDDELEQIIKLTKDYCYGYYSGPLYLKDVKNNPLINLGDMSKLKIERLQPHWMLKNNIFYKVEKDGQMQKLREIIENNGKVLFEGAAEATNILKIYEKYRIKSNFRKF